MTASEERRVRIAVIGAGFGGIGTAVRLRQHGHHDFVIFDRADEVGGTWRDNTYPGCTCDVSSHMYSLSFAPNPDWSHRFSGQAEIWAYLRRVVADHGLAPHLRLGHEVRSATWSPEGEWLIETDHGRWRAEVLVAAGGPLSEPSVPDLPGLSAFTGRVFHSARWDHGHDLTGRRVAVVGTGASAIQFVPRIAPSVERLYVFQRTAPWVLPRGDRAIGRSTHTLYRRVPAARRLARAWLYWTRELSATAFLRPPLMRIGELAARRHLRRSVADPALRAALTPDYTMGCKRVLLSDDYYPALTRDNVELVRGAADTVEPDAVRTADGTRHPVDTIIFGTGFQVTDMPLAGRIRGRDGRLLSEVWQDGMHSYLGTSVVGFPNLFLVLGPNTGQGHNSALFMVECHIERLLRLLRHLDRTGVRAVEPTPRAQDTFVERVDRRMAGTVWSRGGCRSWYVHRTGRNSTIWPGYTWSYWLRARRIDPSAYHAVPVVRSSGSVGDPATAR
ncbi:MAG TPA: NAD(P)/FAD-dependent oxidoreductase [Micromonospora sp.]